MAGHYHHAVYAPRHQHYEPLAPEQRARHQAYMGRLFSSESYLVDMMDRYGDYAHLAAMEGNQKRAAQLMAVRSELEARLASLAPA